VNGFDSVRSNHPSIVEAYLDVSRSGSVCRRAGTHSGKYGTSHGRGHNPTSRFYSGGVKRWFDGLTRKKIVPAVSRVRDFVGPTTLAMPLKQPDPRRKQACH